MIQMMLMMNGIICQSPLRRLKQLYIKQQMVMKSFIIRKILVIIIRLLVISLPSLGQMQIVIAQPGTVTLMQVENI